MTHYVGLKYGSSTISLSGGDTILNNYAVTGAQAAQGGATNAIEETIAISVRGSTSQAAQSNWRAIERWIANVTVMQSAGGIEKLYLELQPSGDATRWQAELLSATLNPDPNALGLWANNEVFGTLSVVRKPWEGDITLLPLSNGHGTNVTTGITVDNRVSGATYSPYVDISASDVDGTLPAPLRLQLQNADGVSRSYERFWVGVNAYANDTSILPGLAGTTMSGSSGQRSYAKWSMAESWSDAFRGRMVRVLLSLDSIVGQWSIQPVVYEYYGLEEIFVGPWVSVNVISARWFDLGVIPIPPTGWTDNLAALQFGIIGIPKNDSSSLTIGAVNFVPTDSGRTIVQRGMQIPAGDYMYFDEIDQVWTSIESGKRHPLYSVAGPGMYVFPGVDQRVTIFHDRGSSGDDSDLLTVQAWYRPRIATV